MFTCKDPLPFYLVETYRELVLAKGGTTRDATTLLLAACQKCGISLKEPEKALQRLDKFYREKAGKQEPKGKLTAVTMGTQFNQWVASLQVRELLAVFSTSYQEASHLYCEVDFEDVNELLNLRLQREAHKALYQMEQVMYGMGGKYKGDRGGSSSSSGPAHDLKSADGRAAAKAAMARLGVLKNG